MKSLLHTILYVDLLSSWPASPQLLSEGPLCACLRPESGLALSRVLLNGGTLDVQ